MKISRIDIKNFRSISKTGFDITGGKIAFVGGNESGKSNVLLALKKFLEKMDFVEEDKYQLSTDEPEITLTFSRFTEEEASQLNQFLNTTGADRITIRRFSNEYDVTEPIIPLDEVPEGDKREGEKESTESGQQEEEKNQGPISEEAAETDEDSEEEVSEPTLGYAQRKQGILNLLPKAVWIKTVEGYIKGKNIPIDEVAVGNWAVVMGIVEDDVLQPKRILISDTSLRPATATAGTRA